MHKYMHDNGYVYASKYIKWIKWYQEDFHVKKVIHILQNTSHMVVKILEIHLK